MSETPSGTTRRSWLKAAPAAAAVLGSGAAEAAAGQANANAGTQGRPNIVFIISDQFRWDCVNAMGLNPMSLTPNMDAMARKGTLFRSAICNQPVCAPTRASMFTGQYPSKHGVWKNAIGIPTDRPTIATALRGAGYTANYIGKWHLAGSNGKGDKESLGPVTPEHRGGFIDLWQASNVLELTSHPYEGDLYDNQGEPIHFSGIYRTDFMTQLAQKFLRAPQTKPFLLVLSYLEVHHQNDIDAFVAPKGYAERYKDFFVPQDLRPLPGSWPHQLADYYGCVAKMDEEVGIIRKTLQETGLDKNTIVLFVSDHGCNFKTRASEYKRSPHESSIHVPLIIEGPGFDHGRDIHELVSHVDLAPSLLRAAGVEVPSTMQGHSFMPLLEGKTEGWRNEVYFEMSEFMTGRGLRTPQYTYAVAAPKHPGWKPAPNSDEYVEYMMYELYADPFQHTNLAGRVPYKEVTDELRSRMEQRIAEASGLHPKITPCEFPYS